MSKENTKYWQDGERRGAEQPKSEITYIESKYLFSGCVSFICSAYFLCFLTQNLYFYAVLFFFFFLTHLKLCFGRCVSSSWPVTCPPSVGKLAGPWARASFLQIQKPNKWLGFFQLSFKNQEMRAHLGLRWDDWEKRDYEN